MFNVLDRLQDWPQNIVSECWCWSARKTIVLFKLRWPSLSLTDWGNHYIELKIRKDFHSLIESFASFLNWYKLNNIKE